MTQEDKQLLLKDLCARLPYGVICLISNRSASITEELKNGGLDAFEVGSLEVKPYLRPMSSMTGEEMGQYEEAIRKDNELFEDDDTYPIACVGVNATDWLLEHHFDYRIEPSTGKTLIESGLALEAPDGMYKAE